MKRTIIVGIAGASGSGKTLVANTICEDLGADHVVFIPEDAYYKDLSLMPKMVRDEMNFDHPEAFEHELMYKHVQDLIQGRSIHLPVYDYETHTRSSETRLLEPRTIIILEGILLFTDEKLRDLMNVKIFIDTPLDICLTRRIRRDLEERGRSVEGILSQYEKTVRPMYQRFIEPSKKYADIIIPRGGKNKIAIDFIKTKLIDMAGKS